MSIFSVWFGALMVRHFILFGQSSLGPAGLNFNSGTVLFMMFYQVTTMSFREIAVTVRAVNRASHEFVRIQTDAEALSVRIKSLGAAISGLGATGVAIGSIAHQFGLLNSEQARVFNSAMMVVSVMGMFMRTSIGVAVAQKIYTAATWMATAAQNALNVSMATTLLLTGVGAAVVIAAAVGMAYFASQMKAATESVKDYNAAVAEMPSSARGIRRAGEEELRRRGVE